MLIKQITYFLYCIISDSLFLFNQFRFHYKYCRFISVTIPMVFFTATVFFFNTVECKRYTSDWRLTQYHFDVPVNILHNVTATVPYDPSILVSLIQELHFCTKLSIYHIFIKGYDFAYFPLSMQNVITDAPDALLINLLLINRHVETRFFSVSFDYIVSTRAHNTTYCHRWWRGLPRCRKLARLQFNFPTNFMPPPP